MGSTANNTDTPERQLQRGCEEGNLEDVQQALDRISPALTLKDLGDWALVSVRAKHAEVVRYLLEKGVPVSFVEEACRAHSPDMFQAMYDHGWQEVEINYSMTRWPNM